MAHGKGAASVMHANSPCSTAGAAAPLLPARVHNQNCCPYSRARSQGIQSARPRCRGAGGGTPLQRPAAVTARQTQLRAQWRVFWRGRAVKERQSAGGGYLILLCGAGFCPGSIRAFSKIEWEPSAAGGQLAAGGLAAEASAQAVVACPSPRYMAWGAVTCARSARKGWCGACCAQQERRCSQPARGASWYSHRRC